MTARCPCGFPDCDLPLCQCGDDCAGMDAKGSGFAKLCCDCWMEWRSARMTCTACGKWRMSDFGKDLFGPGCVCPEPRPPTKEWTP